MRPHVRQDKTVRRVSANQALGLRNDPIHIDAALAYAAELAHEESILPLRPA